MRSKVSILFAPCLVLVLAATLFAGRARAGAPAEFTPVLCDEDGQVVEESLEKAVARLGAGKPAPEHVVLLVHGFNVTVNASTTMFNGVGRLVRSAFGGFKKRVAIVGVQWPSATGGNTRWIKKSVRHTLLGAGHDPYLAKAALAVAVGRQGLRQIVLRLSAALPDARIHVFAHSLGAALTMASLAPHLPDKAGEKVPFLEPDRSVDYDLVCLCGADINQDQTRTGKLTGGSAQMLWITTGFVGPGKDKALEARRKTRHARALGNAAPKLRMDQLDTAVSHCSLVYDSEDIARDHYFTHYYTPARIERLVEAILTIQDREHPRSALLVKLMEVLSAPNTVAALTPFLRSDQASVVFYALWRLDRLVCGSSRHVADDTLRRALSSAKGDPERFARERSRYPCKLIGQGIWPPGTGAATFPEDSFDGSEEPDR